MDIIEHEQNDKEHSTFLQKDVSEFVWASRDGLEGPDLPPLHPKCSESTAGERIRPKSLLTFHQHLWCFVVFQVYKVCSDTFDIYDQHFGRGMVKDAIKEGACACPGL